MFHVTTLNSSPGRFARRLTAIAFFTLGAGAWLSVASPVQALQADLIVETKAGKVRGTEQDGLRVFKGIPFAKPPVGKLRWRAPQPVEPWQGVVNADEFAPGCSQSVHPIMSMPGQAVSEDCLYLNVWSPTASSASPRAVVVWIHGGGFSYGSTAMPLFDGTALAKQDLVFVSLAYRLGPLGFLSHPALTEESGRNASGNYALMDQIAGLEWVQKNIAAFGGDPARVTIMGESAGGMSVSLLTQSPLAEGLFHGVISQSGAAAVNTGMLASLEEAEKAGEALMQRAGATTLAELRALPAEAIIEAATQTSAFTRASAWPIIDGHVIAGPPERQLATEQGPNIALLVGINEREGALFNTLKSADEFKAMLGKRFGDDASRLLEAYPADNDEQAVTSAINFSTDTMFAHQAWAWARLHSRHSEAPVFYYHFDHTPPARPGSPAGAVHGAELPYMFGTMHTRDLAWTDSDNAMSELLITYWSNFIKTGNPNGENVPRWPVFDESDNAIMIFRKGSGQRGTLPHLDRLKYLDPLK